MFTGIITHIGTIESAEQRGDLRITVSCGWPSLSFKTGESIALNGACLTVTEIKPLADGKAGLSFDLSAETVSRTALDQWNKGRRVNMERALKMGDALDGHLVTGHVDGVATLKTSTPSGDSRVLTFDAPKTLSRFIAAKGSVTLDGVSLTVNAVEDETFSVNIIPHTLQETTLGERKTGDKVNLEIDLIARYVERLVQK